MSEEVDLAIVGSGPAGLSAAGCAVQAGLAVTVLDDQDRAGGQIYRNVGGASKSMLKVLGPDYASGRALLDVLDDPGLRHLSGASVWQLGPDGEILFSRDGLARRLRARQIILATGAMERPMPFPGWTLAGVMNAGAAQVLLKSSGVVPTGAVLAGSGPLLYLLAWQYLNAGVPVKALIETTPAGNRGRALAHLGGALKGHSYLRKGLMLLLALGRAGIPHHRVATRLEAHGDETLEGVSFDSGGQRHEIVCSMLLLHQGVVPNVQLTRSLDLGHDWDARSRCWRPRLDRWGESERQGLLVAGDGGGIAGAVAAEAQGRLCALQAACRAGALTAARRDQLARAPRHSLRSHLAVRPFLDALYAPAPEFLRPDDRTLVCRCEEVRAGDIRGFVRLGCLGPNQTKAFGRPGMGPCQGRLCGLTVSELIADERGLCPSQIGYYRIRSPIKPVTLGEMASLVTPEKEGGDVQTSRG